MKKKGQKNKRKSELKVIFFIILVAAALFIISTYAWFSTQKNVSITNLSGIVEVAEGLEISLDAKKWSNDIVLGEGEGQLDIIDDAYADNRNIKPKELLPVSTLGLVKTADGASLKRTDLNMIRGKITNSVELSEIIAMKEELVIEEQQDKTKNHTEDPAYPGYFAFDIFLKNSSKSNVDMDELQLNYDSSVQVLESANSSTGLQNTVRVAFALYGDNVSDVDDEQPDILKNTAGKGVGATIPYITDVAIWEPNASDHVQYIVNNNNKIKWSEDDAKKYATTELEDGSMGFGLKMKMPTYALVDEAINKEIPNIYAWDGSQSLVKKQNVLQTTKTKDEDFEVDSDDDYTISEGVMNLVSSANGTSPFSIPASKVCRLRVYVWLEGQDVDCINYASFGGGIKVNIGLVKGSDPNTYENGATTDPALQ